MIPWLTIDEVQAAKHDSTALKTICDEANVKLAESLHLLARSDWQAGWAAYDWRLRTEQYLRHWWRPWGCPMWRGEPLKGRRLIVHGEQGAGDCIMFARYLPLIDGDVTFLCSDALAPLMRTLKWGGKVVTRADVDGFDRHLPIMSLPFVLGMGEPEAAEQYLFPQDYQHHKGLPDPPVVGLCWRGSPTHANDANRSITLEQIVRYVERGDWISLQHGWVRIHQGVVQVIDGEFRDWEETGSFIAALNEVISVDTAIAHLAGALGVPVKLIIPHEPEWRWAAAWYKSMTIVHANNAAWNERPAASARPHV